MVQDPWFRQFLPDLSKLNLAPPKETQDESEIKAILQVGREGYEWGRVGGGVGWNECGRWPAALAVVEGL